MADIDPAPLANRFWHTLSGGECQRVHIDRTLVQQPRALLVATGRPRKLLTTDRPRHTFGRYAGALAAPFAPAG